MATTSVGGDFTIDVTQLRTLARSLRKLQPELAKEMRAGLKKAAEPIRLEASRRAWAGSSRIPGTIRVRTSGVNVKITAGDGRLAIAGLFELGNKGMNGAGSFRHPVYGNRDVWKDQRTHPYLTPAGRAKQAQAGELIGDVIQSVLERIEV